MGNNNDFDSLNDSFDDGMDFGDDSFDFGDQQGSGNQQGFGDRNLFDNDDSSDIFGGDSLNSSGDDTDDGAGLFSDSVDQMQQQENTEQDRKKITKQAIIMIIAGVIALIVLIALASKLNGKRTGSSQNNGTVNNSNQQTNQNVDNILNSGNSNQTTSGNNSGTSGNNSTIITNKVDNGFTWTLITDNENVQFNENYSDLIFTITSIEHRARATDTNNNLVVITTLQGSISGLSGVYEVDVPYNKGIKLVVGNSFTVHVQLGTYNGKTVVGEIKY